MNKVYIVTSGDYSDYCIHAVFSTSGAAETFCNTFNCDEVEEWDIDGYAELGIGKKPFCVEISKEGNATVSIYISSDYLPPNKPINVFFGRDEILRVYCFANDKQHAIKIANEKRVEFIALNRWGINEKTDNTP